MTKRPVDVFVDAPDSDDSEGGAIARVTAVATGETSTVRIPTRGRRNTPSPSPAGLELDPGTYTIEARLPSGSLERKQVEVSWDREVPPIMFSASAGETVEEAFVPQSVSNARLTTVAYHGHADWLKLAELARTRTVPTHNQLVNALGAAEIASNAAIDSVRGAERYTWFDADPLGPQLLALIERQNLVEVIPLPLPWRTPSGQLARIELTVPTDTDKRTTVMINDPAMRVVLNYLAAGAAVDANALLHADPSWSAITTLQDKTNNPFAASIAACALVLAETSGAMQPWDPWLANLTNFFPRLPDAAVLQATRCLRLRQPDVHLAFDLLNRASTMGLPTFAPITQLFLDGITAFADDDGFQSYDLDDKRLMAVRSVVMRMLSAQGLTTLRFEHRGDVPRARKKK